MLLVSRTEAKLEAVAAELAAAHGVEAQHVAADLARATPTDWARIEAALEGLEARPWGPAGSGRGC